MMAVANTLPRDAFDAVFTRAQVEWALQRCVHGRAQPPRMFKVGIKHLLEFDRRESGDGALAFSEGAPIGSGEYTLFSCFDTVALFIGTRLLELGFKRKEVVLLLREIRGMLEKKLVDELSARVTEAVTEKTRRRDDEINHHPRVRIREGRRWKVDPLRGARQIPRSGGRYTDLARL